LQNGGTKIQDKIKVAFVKFGGLSSGGTEKWLQMMATNMNNLKFEVTFFYCSSAPYIGSDFRHPTTDIDRLKFMKNSRVVLKEFQVGAKDVTTNDHFWVDTNFWDVFDESLFDIVVTAKAGPAEFPFTKITVPIIEYVTLGVGVDQSSSIKWSVHCSEWQRRRWIRMGGRATHSSSLPIPHFGVSSDQNYRTELNIPKNAFVIGMHQRPEDTIYSALPLSAFAQLSDSNTYFLLLGGSKLYGEQAQRMGASNFINLPYTANEEAISKFLNTLDMFAHGRADGETFGTVFSEAMAHGLPLVTHYSNSGANAQSETIGPAGRCVATENEYADFLREVRDNKAFHEVLSLKALEFSEANYSLSSVVQKFENLVTQVLSGVTRNTAISNLSFGRSPLGFLQYGELDNPASIAHHIVEDTIPEKYDILIAGHFLKRSTVFYDVGANIGLYCLFGAEINSKLKVFCFEPQKVCTEQLQRSIYLNNWESRMTIYDFALSDKEHEVGFYLADTGSSIEPDFVGQTLSEPINIKTRRLDSLKLETPNLIKIDVEGHEYQMLQGASQTLSTSHPVIFLELVHALPSRNYVNPNFSKTLDFLFQLNYNIYRSDGKGFLWRVRSTEPQDGILMYLCLPKGKNFRTVADLRILLWHSRLKSEIIRLERRLRNKIIWLIRKYGI
jgi:FkbM family methyltransferase